MLSRLRDPDLRQRLKKEISSDAKDWENIYLGSGGPAGILIGSVVNRDWSRCKANVWGKLLPRKIRTRLMRSLI